MHTLAQFHHHDDPGVIGPALLGKNLSAVSGSVTTSRTRVSSTESCTLRPSTSIW